MKILLYLEDYKYLKKSGIGRALSQQKEALEENGIEVTFDPNDTFDLAHFNSYKIKSEYYIDKFHKQGYKVIVHGHSTHEDFKDSFRFCSLIQPFYNNLLDRIYRKADAIITPTNYSANLISHYKNVKCPIYPLSNGIDLKTYAYSEEKIQRFKNAFNINNEKVVIGVGFPFKRKGLDVFIQVARSFPNIKFIWFGSLAKILTSSYILKCIKNKPNNVILPGYLSGDIIQGAYLYASCLLFPTKEETEGIVVLEALASYCPVVTTNIPVFNGWLDNCNSYLCSNLDEFKKAVNICLQEKNQELLNNGYLIAKERDLKIIGSKLKEIYLNLLETKI